MEELLLDTAIIYYICNTHDPKINEMCQKQLSKVDIPIVCVSLNKRVEFGDININITGKKSPLMMHKQIVLGLKSVDVKNIFLAESDVLYHPSHFNFTPTKRTEFYFNTSVWKMRWSDGHCVWTDNLQQLSGMSANRKLMLNYFENKIKQISENGFDRHFEPVGVKKVNYKSKYPNICIRHKNTQTPSKWSVNDYRNKKYAKGWKETTKDKIEGWNL